MSLLYLDHCSTTPLDPVVAAAMQEVALATPGNPASLHRAGQAARRALEAARTRIAQRLHADIEAVDGDQLVLTSGGTEANNLALFGLAGDPPGRVLVSAVEHPSVLAAAARLEQMGFDCHRIPVDEQGLLRLEQLDALLTDDTRLVSVQFGNHETGVIQPIAEIARRCAGRGIRVHCDAVQAVGKYPVNFHELGVDALTFTAHKFHGPIGIGALLLRAGVQPRPLLYGGTQQLGLRPGTESVALAAGFALALERSLQHVPPVDQLLAVLRDRFEAEIARAVPDAHFAGRNAPRLPHVSNVALPGADRQSLLLALDRAGVACSSGPACQSGASEPSPVLRAMGLPATVVEAALRFSVGRTTSESEIVDAVNRILKTFNDLRLARDSRKYGFPPRFS